MESLGNYPRANPAKWWKTRSVGYAHRAPHATFIGGLRRWVGIIALLLLAGLIGGVVYMTSSKRLAGMAEILLSHALDGHVTVKSAHISLSGVLQLSGVRLTTKVGKIPTRLFSADVVRVDFNWLGLVSGRLSASHISAIHPVVNLVEDMDNGRWNYESFLTHSHSRHPTATHPAAAALPRRPSEPIHLPSIQLSGAVVRWGQIKEGKYTATGASIIDGILQPVNHSRVLYAIQIQQRSIHGHPGLHLTASWNIETQQFAARVPSLRLSGAFDRSLPPQAQLLWSRLGLRGRIADIFFRIRPGNHIEVGAQLAGVSLAIPFHSKRLGSVPIPIDNLSGKVLVRGHVLTISGLHGTAMGWAFVVPHAKFDGLNAGDPFSVTVQLPHMNLPPRLPPIFRTSTFAVADGIFYRLRPRGLLDVTVHVSQDTDNGDTHIAGTIRCLDMAARYVHFPYPISHVHGLIRFTTHRIRFIDVRATAETFPVTLNGMVSINESGGPIDLRIASPRGYFDRRLADCLPRDIKHIWDKFTPVGYGAFRADVTRPASDHSSPKVVLHIFPQDVTGYYHDFPYVMHHVHGEIYFSDRLTKIIKLTAPVGKHGSITFSGNVNYNSGKLSAMKPHVHLVAVNLPVTRDMVYSLPRSFEHALKPFRATGGRVNINAMIGRGADGSPNVVGSLTLSGATLHPKLLPWPLTNVSAQATISPNHFDVQSIDGNIAGDSATSVHATVKVHDPQTGPVIVQSQGEWKGLVLTATPPRQLPLKYQAMWRKYRPSGRLGGGFHLGLSISHHGHATLWQEITHLGITLKPSNMTLSPLKFPAPVTNISGRLVVKGGKVQVQSILADAGPITLSASGFYIPKTGLLKLKAQAISPTIPLKWLAILPKKARKFVLGVHPIGGFELYFSDLERRIEKSGPGWKFVGSLIFHNLSLKHTLKATIGKGVVTIAGDLDAHETVPDLAGEFHLRHVLIAGHKARAIKGEVIGDRLTNTVKISHITGSVADGKLAGEVDLHVSHSPSFTAHFHLTGAQLVDLLKTQKVSASTKPAPVRHAKANEPSASSGIVDANVDLSQILGDINSTRGSGSLTITKADIYNVPLSMGLLQIATLRLPVSSSFNHAQITYQIKGETLKFSKIELESPGVDLLGRGHMNLATEQLDLELITQSPSGTSIPLLGLIFGMARSQLLQLHVYGPISKPIIAPIPLRILAFPFGGH